MRAPLGDNPAWAERYARECLLPEHDFRVRANRTDYEFR